MKTVIDAAGTLYGPFAAIEQRDGALHCGGAVLPLAVLGNGWQIVDGGPPGATQMFLWDGAGYKARPPEPAQVAAACAAAIQRLLDDTAQEHGYDDLARCISYIGDAVPFWSAEATRAKAWRSACWSKAKQIQDAAAAGNWPTVGARQMPTVADVMAAMPASSWPVAP